MISRLFIVFAVLSLLLSAAHADMVRITVSLANVRVEPGSHHKIITSVKKGELLPVVDSGEKWWQVRLPDGRTGWIYKNAVHLEKEDYNVLIEVMTQKILGAHLKWAALNEVYLEEYHTARLDVMISQKWSRLDTEQQKNLMIHVAREFARLCEKDDVLKARSTATPYVAFFDRFNTLLGKADKTNAVFANEESEK
jgi:SH3-like domain-containing protein